MRRSQGPEVTHEEGELVVCPTDRTGKFAVMGRDIYEGDDIVGWEDLKIFQREVNGLC